MKIRGPALARLVVRCDLLEGAAFRSGVSLAPNGGDRATIFRRRLIRQGLRRRRDSHEQTWHIGRYAATA